MAEVVTVDEDFLERGSALLPATRVHSIKIIARDDSMLWRVWSSTWRDEKDFDRLVRHLRAGMVGMASLWAVIADVRANWGTERGAARLEVFLNALLQRPGMMGLQRDPVVRDFFGLDYALVADELQRFPFRIVELNDGRLDDHHHRAVQSGFNTDGAPGAPSVTQAVGFHIAAVIPFVRHECKYDDICVFIQFGGCIYAAARRYKDFRNLRKAAAAASNIEPRAVAAFPSRQPWWKDRHAVTVERVPQLRDWLAALSFAADHGSNHPVCRFFRLSGAPRSLAQAGLAHRW